MITSRTRKQQTNLKISWQYIIKAAVIVLFFALLLFGAAKLRQVQPFPVKSVKIYGVQHSDQAQLQAFLIPLVKRGFFGVDVDLIKERILQSPWVANTTVRRVWPDQVVVGVIEKQPIARWNDTSLLSNSGQLFNPPTETYPAGLPQFVGGDGQQLVMAEYYEKINNLLAPLQFKITRLELSPTLSWNLTLNNGIKLSVGHKDVLTRVSHFVKVYPKISVRE